MKKKHAIYLAVALAVIGGTLAFRLWPRTVPPEQTSELYVRYHGTPGVDATFIKDFRVNDTVSVDVTLLQATDSVGWETLLSNLRMPEDTKEVMKTPIRQRRVIMVYFPKDRFDLPPDPIICNNDLLAIDMAEQTLAVFNITDEKQAMAIIEYHFNKIK